MYGNRRETDTINSTEDVKGGQQRPNKAIHATAYSLRFGRKPLRSIFRH